MFARNKGLQIEQQACDFLKNQRLTLVTKNYQCRQGEIDLIMLDKNILVFIEVRYRQNSQFGSAQESVNKQKQTKIIYTAQHFLQQYEKAYSGCRFDVIASTMVKNKLQLEWIKDAFRVN